MVVEAISAEVEERLTKMAVKEGINEDNYLEFLFTKGSNGELMLFNAVKKGAKLKGDVPAGVFVLTGFKDKRTLAEVLLEYGRAEEIPASSSILAVQTKKGVPLGLEKARRGLLTWEHVVKDPSLGLIADESGWTVAHEIASHHPISLEEAKKVPFEVFRAHDENGWAVVHEAITKEGSLIEDEYVLNTIDPQSGKSAFALGIERNETFREYVKKNPERFYGVFCFFDEEEHRLVNFKEVIEKNFAAIKNENEGNRCWLRRGKWVLGL